MSFGECDTCEHALTTEEYNVARFLRPTAREPRLCFSCIRKMIAENNQLQGQRDDLLAACKIHQDCLELDEAGLNTDNETVVNILEKYEVGSNLDLEILRDNAIKAAIAKAKKLFGEFARLNDG